MNVDKAGRNDLPLRVQHLTGFVLRNTGRHLRDTPRRNGNVLIAKQVLRWIDDPSAPHEKIVAGCARVGLSRKHAFATAVRPHSKRPAREARQKKPRREAASRFFMAVI